MHHKQRKVTKTFDYEFNKVLKEDFDKEMYQLLIDRLLDSKRVANSVKNAKLFLYTLITALVLLALSSTMQVIL